jgi:hypothetical protein
VLSAAAFAAGAEVDLVGVDGEDVLPRLPLDVLLGTAEAWSLASLLAFVAARLADFEPELVCWDWSEVLDLSGLSVLVAGAGAAAGAGLAAGGGDVTGTGDGVGCGEAGACGAAGDDDEGCSIAREPPTAEPVLPGEDAGTSSPGLAADAGRAGARAGAGDRASSPKATASWIVAGLVGAPGRGPLRTPGQPSWEMNTIRPRATAVTAPSRPIETVRKRTSMSSPVRLTPWAASSRCRILERTVRTIDLVRRPR